MPLFNQIGQPRWNSPLVRFFGMKIGGAAAPSLAPEIAPSFDINQQDDAQLAFLRGEKLAAYGTSISAAPGFYSSAALRNPVGSGVLLIVNNVLAATGSTAAVISVAVLTADLTTSGNCTLLDSRWGTNQTTSARYSFRNDSAGPVSGNRVVQLNAAVNSYLPVNIVISPGFGLVIETAAVNGALVWGVLFRERAIPAEELATG